jgi:hypothetical protein
MTLRWLLSATRSYRAGWSRVHGFFAVMGGFVSHDGGEVLSLERIERLVESKAIEYPIASADEIRDRSKGDAVAKALVVFQTSWFLVQCVARGIQRLAVTEAELATAAFALLNIATYTIWWDKPLDVMCPIRVRRTRAPREENEGAAGHGGGAAGTGQMMQGSSCWSWSRAKTAMKPFTAMIAFGEHDDMFFVVGELPDDAGFSSLVGAVLLTMVFGGIHCIGWSSQFPSRAERLLWRISSIAITGTPLVYPCIGLIVANANWHSHPSNVFVLPLLFYVSSRMVLLVLCVTTLRSLPVVALQTVKWTTFLPHI